MFKEDWVVPLELVAESVRGKLPSGSEVLPSIKPVAEFIVKPDGKEPELTE